MIKLNFAFKATFFLIEFNNFNFIIKLLNERACRKSKWLIRIVTERKPVHIPFAFVSINLFSLVAIMIGAHISKSLVLLVVCWRCKSCIFLMWSFHYY